MPGKYAPPAGLRPIDPPGCCELKRLFVSLERRGTGLGRRLVHAAMEVAERIAYRELWLDTLPSMAGAQSLYRRLGFEVMDP